MPGETRAVQVRVRGGQMPSQPGFVAEGLNVRACSWNGRGGKSTPIRVGISQLETRQQGHRKALWFSAAPAGPAGTRITTAPVSLVIDGQLHRYVSVAVKPGQALIGRIELPVLAPGSHRIELGDQTINAEY
jgi:hypothetical protein